MWLIVSVCLLTSTVSMLLLPLNVLHKLLLSDFHSLYNIDVYLQYEPVTYISPYCLVPRKIDKTKMACQSKVVLLLKRNYYMTDYVWKLKWYLQWDPVFHVMEGNNNQTTDLLHIKHILLIAVEIRSVNIHIDHSFVQWELFTMHPDYFVAY